VIGHLLPLTPYPYRGTRIDCPVCGSADHAPIATIDRKWKRLTTELCNACGMFYTNPMPTDAELAAYYASTYRLEYQFRLGRPARAHVARKAAEARFRLEVIRRVLGDPAGLRTLDAGCGSGELVAALAAAGAEAHGFEPGAGFAAEAAGGDGAVRTGRWDEMDYAAESVDLVTCLHVLEHLNRPVAALTRMASWLAPCGVLYLEVPNMQHYEPKGTERFHFAHVLGFSGDTLKLAAERAGLGLLREEQPTSLLLVRGDDPRARPFTLDLAGTAAANRRDYGAALGIGDRVGYQLRRVGRLIGKSRGFGK